MGQFCPCLHLSAVGKVSLQATAFVEPYSEIPDQLLFTATPQQILRGNGWLGLGAAHVTPTPSQ